MTAPDPTGDAPATGTGWMFAADDNLDDLDLDATTGTDASPAEATVKPEHVAPELVAAREHLAAATAAVATATRACESGHDAAADAAGALQVAVAKLADYQDDPTKAPWQVLAAEQAVAKAERAVARRTATHQRLLDDRDRAVGLERDAAAAVEAAQAAAEGGPVLQFATVNEFVRDYLRFMYKRVISRGRGHVWAARWWDYPEAVARLEALWRAWEHLRLDPVTGMSTWYRDHADHHLPILMNPEHGPFGDQTTDTIDDTTAPLPHEEPPRGMFTQER